MQRLSFKDCEFEVINLIPGDIDRYRPIVSSRANIYKRIDFINQQLSGLAGYGRLPGSIFSFADLVWGVPKHTGHFVWVNFPDKTPAGRLPKYDAVLHATAIHKPGSWNENDPTSGGDYAFTDIHYTKDVPGKARVVIWQNDLCFVIYFKTVKRRFFAWKSEVKRGNEVIRAYNYPAEIEK